MLARIPWFHWSAAVRGDDCNRARLLLGRRHGHVLTRGDGVLDQVNYQRTLVALRRGDRTYRIFFAEYALGDQPARQPTERGFRAYTSHGDGVSIVSPAEIVGVSD